ncbi:hypothetical protein K491DRAFT_428844 [Lophiostoma macrostomum CBS 122681]|uniref:Peptidase A2 domain-containing protein n=1 Tax=Lophiostoma macrostomum CBS 122681 TaxID=1314788 RepID=A0A6A6T6I2_9PLEO|nr:hypothetical protein K491DRAFT_428844 [Lophiostoma macrostomum CBS 122681]
MTSKPAVPGAVDTAQKSSLLRLLLKRFSKRLLLRILQLHHGSTDDSFLRSVVVEVVYNGSPVRRTALALFDTGSPTTLMSRTLAESLGLTFSSENGRVLLNGLGGGQFVSVGKIHGRWTCSKNSPTSRFSSEPRHYNGVWEVSGRYDDGFDVIFGRDTIVTHRLLEVKRKLAATATHRRCHSKVDSECLRLLQLLGLSMSNDAHRGGSPASLTEAGGRAREGRPANPTAPGTEGKLVFSGIEKSLLMICRFERLPSLPDRLNDLPSC